MRYSQRKFLYDTEETKETITEYLKSCDKKEPHNTMVLKPIKTRERPQYWILMLPLGLL